MRPLLIILWQALLISTLQAADDCRLAVTAGKKDFASYQHRTDRCEGYLPREHSVGRRERIVPASFYYGNPGLYLEQEAINRIVVHSPHPKELLSQGVELLFEMKTHGFINEAANYFMDKKLSALSYDWSNNILRLNAQSANPDLYQLIACLQSCTDNKLSTTLLPASLQQKEAVKPSTRQATEQPLLTLRVKAPKGSRKIFYKLWNEQNQLVLDSKAFVIHGETALAAIDLTQLEAGRYAIALSAQSLSKQVLAREDWWIHVP